MEEDPRFSHIVNDPKFRHIPKGSIKIKIDDRFGYMFKDKSFNVKYSADKRGRPVRFTSKEDLKRYYELSSEESGSNDEEQEVGKYVKAPKNNDIAQDSSDTNELEQKLKSDKNIPDNVKQKLKNLTIDYARGESKLFSESSSDDESEQEELEDEGIEHKWGEFDADAETTEEATCRLAACNMDWDRIRAVDLMVLFNSFLSAGNTIVSVSIYPSEFGLQRMKEEEVKGPTELVESQKQEYGEEETEEGSRYHMEKLREYQLNRLKYYYAVIIFDSVSAANKVYTECDGMEYESSSTKLDLRFVPDDMNFDQEPREVCTNLPDMTKYQPRFFTTTALQQAKVDLTWDETNPDRIELTQKLNSGKLDEIDNADLQDYLASSSGEESEDNVSENENDDDNESSADPINKYRALLETIEENEKKKEERDIQMEVHWDVDLKEKSEKLVQQKLAEKEDKTPFEQYLDKRKAKKKEKKKQKKTQDDEGSDDDSDIPDGIDMNDPYFAEEFNKPEFRKKKTKAKKEDSESGDDNEQSNDLELLVWNEEEDNKKHFSLEKIQDQESKKGKKKRKKKKEEDSKEDNFNVNVNDERFAALFTSHHYDINPTNPHFRRTKAVETLIDENLKRSRQADKDATVSKKPKLSEKKNPELNMLVKSVKQKAQAFNKKNK